MRAAGLVTCLCWLGAFLLGSVPLGHLLQRSRLRRDLRRLERGPRRSQGSSDLRMLMGGGAVDPASALPTLTEVLGAALDTAKVVGLAIASLWLVRAASPAWSRSVGGGVGPIGATQLSVWQSASLWAGLAAGVAHLWSMWLGFRSAGQAQVPLLGLAVRFTPTAFVVAVAGYVIGRVGGQARLAVLLSLVGFVGWSWAAWLWNLPHWWGFGWGPELGIWAAVMAGVVAARNLRAGSSSVAGWPA